MLPRRMIVILLIIGLVVAISSPHQRSSTPLGRAQELPTTAPGAATPVDLSQVAPYPDGVELNALAAVPIDSVPANPASIRLERYTLGTGDRLTGATPGPRLIVVEQGDLLVSDTGSSDGTYGPAGSLLIPSEDPANLTPGSREPVTLLQFRIDPEAAPSPLDVESTASPQVLLTGSPRLPRGAATIAIVRLSVEPDADTGQRVFSGPVGLAVEAGTLTVVDLDGQPARLEARSSLIAPAYTAHQLRNDGPEEVTGLAVGILPASPALAGAPVATPTPAVDLAATATVAALVQTEADLRATIVAQEASDAELRSILATQEAVSGGAISNAQATTSAIAIGAVELAGNIATANAQSFAAEATIISLRPTLTALETELGTATAQEASLVATSAAQSVALQTVESRADSLATSVTLTEQAVGTSQASVDQAQATISAQAAAMQTVVATATAQALQAQAVQSTAAAQLAASENVSGTQAAAEGTRAAELVAVQATVTAQAAAIATLEAATEPAVELTYREVMIETDVSGVAFGDLTAEQTIISEVRDQLQAEIRQGCRAGLVLTFGYAFDVTTGGAQAGAINELLAAEIPEMFANAQVENFANLEQPAGRAQIRVYLTTACDPASPVIVVLSPTSPPIVPSQ